MDDDVNRHEVDARLREVLRPPGAIVERVVSGALRRQQPGTPVRWRLAALTAAGLLVVVAVAWQRAGLRQPDFPTTTAAPRSGHYVIVVPASEVTP